MEIKTDSVTGSRPSRWLVFAAIVAFATGCGGGGTDDTGNHDALSGDVTTETDDGAGQDNLIADTERDEQSTDAAGDGENPPDIQDADQDTHVPAGLMEILPEEIYFACSATKKWAVVYLTVKNVGDGGLSISSIQVMTPTCDASTCLFSINSIQYHEPDGNISAGTGPIQPNGFATVELKFELVGPETGDYAASLQITSDSAVNPTVVVPMHASILHPGTCRLEIVPAHVNFGVIPVGFPKSSGVRLVNTGTGPCLIDGIKIADCAQNGETVTCPDPMTGDDSTVFTLESDETLTMATVQAGGQAFAKIVYTPPVAGDDTTTYQAMLSVQSRDMDDNVKVTPACGGETGVACVPNLSGAIVLDTNVYPQAVDFGLVRTECGTGQAKVCYYNTADAAVLVKVDASQCGPEFVFDGISENWDNAFKGIPWCIEVDYRPTDAGTDTCTVLFNEYGTQVTSQEFTLTGEASTFDGVTDTFGGHTGQTEFDIRGIPVAASVVVRINDFECDDWSVGGTGLDATIVVGESCPVQHLDTVEITYDLECVMQPAGVK